MLAPRALLLIENTSMYWLGNHEHCHFPEAQRPELVAFVQKFLIGDGSADTHIVKTDGDFKVDEQRWVDWATPTLQ